MSEFLIIKKGCNLPEEAVNFEKAFESSEYSIYTASKLLKAQG